LRAELFTPGRKASNRSLYFLQSGTSPLIPARVFKSRRGPPLPRGAKGDPRATRSIKSLDKNVRANPKSLAERLDVRRSKSAFAFQNSVGNRTLHAVGKKEKDVDDLMVVMDRRN